MAAGATEFGQESVEMEDLLHRPFDTLRELADSFDVTLADLAGHMAEMHVANVLLEFRDDLGHVAAVDGNLEALPLPVLLQLSPSLVELAD